MRDHKLLLVCLALVHYRTVAVLMQWVLECNCMRGHKLLKDHDGHLVHCRTAVAVVVLQWV